MIKLGVYILIFVQCVTYKAHLENVITFNIEEHHDYLQIDTQISKEYVRVLQLFEVLKVEELGVNFSLQQYISKHVELSVNKKLYALNFSEIKTDKDRVYIQYTIPKSVPVKSVQMRALKLIYGADDHAQIAVKLVINESNRLFKIKKERTTILAKY